MGQTLRHYTQAAADAANGAAVRGGNGKGKGNGNMDDGDTLPALLERMAAQVEEVRGRAEANTLTQRRKGAKGGEVIRPA